MRVCMYVLWWFAVSTPFKIHTSYILTVLKVTAANTSIFALNIFYTWII